jgi:oxygen-independent coproporphyrinogen-3 oxidase
MLTAKCIIIPMPLGLYIAVPFCRTKCTYCNFASDVFSRAIFDKYMMGLCAEIDGAAETSRQVGVCFEPVADSVYLGGGTPTLLDISQMERLFVSIRQNFDLQVDAEITVECAPGTLSPEKVEVLARCSVNRVSLGVQSFVDHEAASVGRLHKRDSVFDDITRLRDAGITNINVDLIAGLPHQTVESWSYSLDQLIASGVPHTSVYMLEVDEYSRLGRELIAGGQKYHAHFVPNDDLTADFYEIACDRLNAAEIEQYEISNFSRPGFESRHNLKYWTRQPYLGFGVDAHSMLLCAANNSGVRFSNADSLENYLAGATPVRKPVSEDAALQEAFFLGLRLNRGVKLEVLSESFGGRTVAAYRDTISELISAGVLLRDGDGIRLTARGRLLSNEVFQNFISIASI